MKLLGQLAGPGQGGLAAFPNGNAILYTKVVSEGSDLVMIEDFR